LQAIHWADDKSRDWIDEIDDAHAVVEVGFAQFGDPDLILVCNTPHSRTYIVFVEAKAKTYRDSMKSNFHPGMGAQGFNSSINGQLMLKYRFAQALLQWDAEPSEPIVEPPEIHQVYRKDKLKDPLKTARRLKKKDILSRILVPLGIGHQTSEDDFYYVSLTWDAESHVFFKDDGVSEEYLPRFLDRHGRDRFKEMACQIGWIGFKQLEKALDLTGNTQYVIARDTMVSSSEPNQTYYSRKSQRAWETLSEEVRDLAKKISHVFTNCNRSKEHASYSIRDRVEKRTIAKVIPYSNSVFVGVRLSDHSFESIEVLIGPGMREKLKTVIVRNVEFKGIEVAVDAQEDKMKSVEKLVDGFLKYIGEKGHVVKCLE